MKKLTNNKDWDSFFDKLMSLNIYDIKPLRVVKTHWMVNFHNTN